MSDHPHKYMLQLNAGGGQNVNSESLDKFDLDLIRTEASMVAEILDETVVIYSVPTYGGGRWQVLERVTPPVKGDKTE